MNELSYLFTASVILAKAVMDLFPKALLVKVETTPLEIQCQFIIDPPLSSEYIPQIEERYRALVTKHIKIEPVTMLRTNAIELFKHQKQTVLVHELEMRKEEVLELCRIGEYIHPCPHKLLNSTYNAAICKIVSIQNLPYDVKGIKCKTLTSIRACAAIDKQSLKSMIKTFEHAKEKDYRIVGVQKDYFLSSTKEWILLPLGVELKEKLRSFWFQELQKRGFRFVETHAKTKESIVAQMQTLLPHMNQTPLKLAEWATLESVHEKNTGFSLLDLPLFTSDLMVVFAKREGVLEELISTLQLIKLTMHTMQLEYVWVLTCSQRKTELDIALQSLGIDYKVQQQNGKTNPLLEVYVQDVYGRAFSCGYIVTHTSKQNILIQSSLFGSIERFLALLIEKSKI